MFVVLEIKLTGDQKAIFYFLQETYSEPDDELFWKNEWGGEIYFSRGTRHSIIVKV